MGGNSPGKVTLAEPAGAEEIKAAAGRKCEEVEEEKEDTAALAAAAAEEKAKASHRLGAARPGVRGAARRGHGPGERGRWRLLEEASGGHQEDLRVQGDAGDVGDGEPGRGAGGVGRRCPFPRGCAGRPAGACVCACSFLRVHPSGLLRTPHIHRARSRCDLETRKKKSEARSRRCVNPPLPPTPPPKKDKKGKNKCFKIFLE